MSERGTRFYSHLSPTQNAAPLDRSIRDWSLGGQISCGASTSRDERIRLLQPEIFRIFRPDYLVHPDRIVDSVQILFTEIRGDGHNRVAFFELRGEPLDRGQNRAGAAPDKQMIVSNERQAGFNRRCFAYFDDSVRLREICELWPDAGANAGNVSLGGRTPEGN